MLPIGKKSKNRPSFNTELSENIRQIDFYLFTLDNALGSDIFGRKTETYANELKTLTFKRNKIAKKLAKLKINKNYEETAQLMEKSNALLNKIQQSNIVEKYVVKHTKLQKDDSNDSERYRETEEQPEYAKENEYQMPQQTDQSCEEQEDELKQLNLRYVVFYQEFAVNCINSSYFLFHDSIKLMIGLET